MLLAQEVDGIVGGKNGAKGIIVFSLDFSMVEQAAVVKLPHFMVHFWPWRMQAMIVK